MPSMKLNVPALRDRADEAKLVRLVCGQPGVYGAVACSKAQCMEVDFEDDEVTPDQLIEMLQAAGFESRLAG